MKERKKATEKRLTHRVHTRVTKEKHEELTALLKRSLGIHSLSELLRHILDNRPVILQTVDRTTDIVMGELSAIRKELHAIGVNINQVTHRFHTEDLPESRLLKALEIARLYQQTDGKVTELFAVIARLSGSWLPG